MTYGDWPSPIRWLLRKKLMFGLHRAFGSPFLEALWRSMQKRAPLRHSIK
jgi:hypothetical protein